MSLELSIHVVGHEIDSLRTRAFCRPVLRRIKGRRLGTFRLSLSGISVFLP